MQNIIICLFRHDRFSAVHKYGDEYTLMSSHLALNPLAILLFDVLHLKIKKPDVKTTSGRISAVPPEFAPRVHTLASLTEGAVNGY